MCVVVCVGMPLCVCAMWCLCVCVLRCGCVLCLFVSVLCRPQELLQRRGDDAGIPPTALLQDLLEIHLPPHHLSEWSTQTHTQARKHTRTNIGIRKQSCLCQTYQELFASKHRLDSFSSLVCTNDKQLIRLQTTLHHREAPGVRITFTSSHQACCLNQSHPADNNPSMQSKVD